MLAQLLFAPAILLLASSAAYAQTNDTLQWNQKPAEEKQEGGDYSGFDETGEQMEGLSGKEANPTPQAPISDLDVQQQTQTTAPAAMATARPASGVSGSLLLAGMGAVAAAAIIAAVWYFRKRGR